MPPKGEYGTGLIFFSQKQAVRDQCKAVIERHCEAKGFKVIAWRDVPIDNSSIGPSALASEPRIIQLFVAPTSKLEPTVLETELMILRRLFEREIRGIGEVSLPTRKIRDKPARPAHGGLPAPPRRPLAHAAAAERERARSERARGTEKLCEAI